MLENLRRPGSGCGSKVSIRKVAAITKAGFFSSIVVVIQPIAAATLQTDHSIGDRGRWIKICKVDIQRFCDEANLKQECLIAHWSKISTECQDVLGSSAGNRAGDGS